MMQAGRLDQRITIERYQFVSQNPMTGEEIYSWVPIATVWGAVEPLNGREFIAAAAVQSEITTRIRIRYRSDLMTADRVSHEGKVHDVQAIINPRSGDRELVLMCKSQAS